MPMPTINLKNKYVECDVRGSTIKPRTPADIGRDIAAAEQRIRDLKAELADVPPQRLEFRSELGMSDLALTANSSGGATLQHSGQISCLARNEVGRVRDWLNYYFPKGA